MNYRLILRIRYDAKHAHRLLGSKFGCDAELEAPALMRQAKELGLNVYIYIPIVYVKSNYYKIIVYNDSFIVNRHQLPRWHRMQRSARLREGDPSGQTIVQRWLPHRL